MKYAGHIKQNEEDGWKRRVLEWVPCGSKRKRGRPKKRWEVEIIKFCGIAWGRDAGVRGRWARIGEAYAQRLAEHNNA